MPRDDVTRNAEVGTRNERAGVCSAFRVPHSALGFTLIEVVVALTIGALVVLVANQLFAAVVERGRTLVAARTALDRAANAHRWLQATFLSLDVGTDGAGGFDGRPDHAAFSTWLLTRDGWFERRQVTLSAEQRHLRAAGTPGMPIALMDSVTDLQFDYLLEPGAESRWARAGSRTARRLRCRPGR